MKKLILVNLLALSMAIPASAIEFADVISPYTEHFENENYLPKGWKMVNTSTSSFNAAKYTTHETGGKKDGYITVNQAYSSSNSSYYSYEEVLIPPTINGGEISIWVRRNGSAPQLSFYKLTSNTSMSRYNNNWLEGTTMNMVTGLDIDDWTKITVPNVAEGTIVGIRAHNLDIDEFEASSVKIVYTPSIKTSLSNLTGARVNLDADGNATIKFKVTLENNGEVDFPADGEGFKIELENRRSTSIFGTAYITEAIPVGAKVEKEISFTGHVELLNGDLSSSYPHYVNITHEYIGKKETVLEYITFMPYAPRMRFMFNEKNDANETTTVSVDATGTTVIGVGPTGTSRTLWLWNAGSAPMEISSTTLPEGFTADVNAFTVAAGEKKAVKISITGEPGLKTGKITFNEKTLGEVEYSIAGFVTKNGDYLENFEAEGHPAGYIYDDSWTHTDVVSSLQAIAGTWTMEQNSTYNMQKLITPRLKFEEGEILAFTAAKTNKSSSKLKVYTSTDRSNWTQLLEIGSSYLYDNEFNPDLATGLGSNFEYTLFTIPMKAGEQYIAFEAGAARVDNIAGGQLVPVAHDLLISGFQAPEKGFVNSAMSIAVTLENVGTADETAYDIVLESEGKQIAKATTLPTLATGSKESYEVRYTPHDMGEISGKLVFISGEDRVELGDVKATIGEEQAAVKKQVGETKLTEELPFKFRGTKASQCQIIYPKDALGLTAGTKISGLSLRGYIQTSYGFNRDFKVWIENTDDEGYDSNSITARATSEMTEIHVQTGESFSKLGGNNDFTDILGVTLDEPFVYTGSNIRVVLQQSTSYAGNYDYVYYNIEPGNYNSSAGTYENKVIYAEATTEAGLANPSWQVYRYGYPVATFSYNREPIAVSGVVTDEFNAPVEGCALFLESDDILYKATSDTEGKYSMNVLSVGRTYTLAGEAGEYERGTTPDVNIDGASKEVNADLKLKFTDRTATITGHVYNLLPDQTREPLAKASVVISNGTASQSVESDATGLYTATVDEFTNEFTIAVTKGTSSTTPLHTSAHSFASKADKKDFDVEYSVTVSGTVTDDFGKPVNACNIELERGIPGEYTTTTDEDGKYTLVVRHVTPTYVLSAAADGLHTEVVRNIVLDDPEPFRTIDFGLKYTDRSATLTGYVYNIGSNNTLEPLEEAAVRLDNGEMANVALTDADGKYTLTVNDFSLPYTLTVSKGATEEYLFNEPYTFASKADEKNFEVRYSELSEILVDGKATVSVNERYVTVVAPLHAPVALYDARGTLLGNDVSDGSSITFGPLMPGIYIAAGTKIVIR